MARWISAGFVNFVEELRYCNTLAREMRSKAMKLRIGHIYIKYV